MDDDPAISTASRWPDLAPDLLRDIAGRVHDVADFIRLYAVCRSWRDSRSRTPTSRAQFLPWLLAPPSGGPLRFRCVFSKRSYHAPSPSSMPPRTTWVSTADGTAVRYLTVDEHRRPTLHDPLTGAAATRSMPPFPFTWLPWQDQSPRGVMYDDGAILVYGISCVRSSTAAKFRAALLRSGDNEWTLVERNLVPPPLYRCEFCAAYQAGKILVTVKPGFWRVITLNGDMVDDAVTDVLVPKPWSPRRDDGYTYQSSHVLESRGELLWASVQAVRRNYYFERGVDGRGLLHVLSVSVHKLEEDPTSNKMQWVRKDNQSLLDRVLFLGWPSSFAMDASLLGGGGHGGCIYFIYCDSGASPCDQYAVFRYNLVVGKAEFVERLPPSWDDEACTWFVPRTIIHAAHLIDMVREHNPSLRLVVRNLPLTVDSTQLGLFFSEHGKVSSAEVIYYKETKRSQVHVSASASARQPSPPPACYGSPPSAVGLRRRPARGLACPPSPPLPRLRLGSGDLARRLLVAAQPRRSCRRCLAFPALLPAPSASSRDHGAAASPHAARGQPPRLTRLGPAAVAHTAGVLRRPSPLSTPASSRNQGARRLAARRPAPP
ncbi:hypothetical protein ZWY2020_026108 [Hordeum vulgare]|nr:hypothetical protein ZWY2020_026108 [Hordeum vulgare]